MRVTASPAGVADLCAVAVSYVDPWAFELQFETVVEGLGIGVVMGAPVAIRAYSDNPAWIIETAVRQPADMVGLQERIAVWGRDGAAPPHAWQLPFARRRT